MPNSLDDRKGALVGGRMTMTPDERNEHILGNPPRIPPLQPSEYTEQIVATAAELRRAAGAPPDPYIPDFVATMLRHPKLCVEHTDLALYLMSKGTLPNRDRELAVLRNAWLCQAPFEWNAHVEIGKRGAGLSEQEIEWITVGSSAPGWGEHDRAILKAIEEMFDVAMISDETWAVLAKDWSYEQLIEFPILIGQYIGIAFLQNSIRNKLMPGHVGLAAR